MHPLKRRGKSNDQLLSENEVMLLILIEIHFAFYELELFQIIFYPHLIFFFASSSSHLLFHFSRISSFPLFLFSSFPLFLISSSSLPHLSLLYRNPTFCYFSYPFFPFCYFYYHLFDVMRLQRYGFIGQMTLLSSKVPEILPTGAETHNLHPWSSI